MQNLSSNTRVLPQLATLILACLLLAHCSSNSKKLQFVDTSEQGLYQRAVKQIKNNLYDEAAETLQTMEANYPFGEYSKSAQLALIYVYYKYDELAASSASADRFIRLHPQYRHVDYAYYMKGLIEFPKSKSLLQQTFKVNLSKRDISAARVSFNHFSTLVKRFPDSEYAADAIKRMTFLRNQLARHELYVANYYFERKAYLAAANRGRYVVENFQETPSIPDALAVMVQGYSKMKMTELAANSLLVLKQNYPDYPALDSNGEFNLRYSTQTNTSWIDFITLGLLGSNQPPGFNTEEQYNQ